MWYMEFGEKVQLLRKESGMSQEKLAERLNVSRQAISKWEQGIVLPDTENIIQLSKFFQVPLEYLLINECENIDRDIEKTKAEKVESKNKHWLRKIVIGVLIEIVAISATYVMQWLENEMYGSFYTNPLYYLRKMPLVLIVIFGVIIFIVGVVEFIKESPIFDEK